MRPFATSFFDADSCSKKLRHTERDGVHKLMPASLGLRQAFVTNTAGKRCSGNR